MNIAIIGAGIVGLTTALELAADGHAVTVFERERSAACGASFATGAVMAPGLDMSLPLGGGWRRWLGSRWQTDATLLREGRLSWRQRRWLARSRRALHSDDHASDLARLHRLASDSATRLSALLARQQWTPEHTEGLLVLLRRPQDVARMAPELARWRDLQVPFVEMDETAARQVEPALNPDTPLTAAIHLPKAQVINCRQVALLIKDGLVEQGVGFEMSRDVKSLQADTGGVLVQCADGWQARFDHVVVCAGDASAALLAPLGLRLPLQAIHGYSLSAALREPLNAPRSAVWDATHRTSVSRMGQRVRVAGVAQIGQTRLANIPPGPKSPHQGVPDAALRTLRRAASDWFPVGAAWGGQVQVWQGARAVLPDGMPAIGASGTPGVWLNLGHADQGWTLACGSARLLADQVAGRTLAAEWDRLSPQRLR